VEYNFLKSYYSPRVEIVLHAANDLEVVAAISILGEPGDYFKSAVVFPNGNMIVGKLAEKKAALVKGADDHAKLIKEAMLAFPNAVYVLQVGACVSFDNKRHKLGDVLVSDSIHNVNMETGIPIGGESENIADDLCNLFCNDMVHKPQFAVSEGRNSEVYSGTILSTSREVMKYEEIYKLLSANPTTVSYEIGFYDLWKSIAHTGSIKGIISIKGVCSSDFVNNPNWVTMATLAAVNYAKSKLLHGKCSILFTLSCPYGACSVSDIRFLEQLS
jgi:hypothetical protein